MKLKVLSVIFLSVLLSGITGVMLAQDTKTDMTPVGFWKTVDDKMGDVRSIVRIWIDDKDGTLRGRVEDVFPRSDEPKDPKCELCPGKFKNQRIRGIEFMWGFKGAGAEWKGGKILDPKNGKIYNCQLEVIENGQKIEVFGYIRVIFKIGRSQTWLRYTPEK